MRCGMLLQAPSSRLARSIPIDTIFPPVIRPAAPRATINVQVEPPAAGEHYSRLQLAVAEQQPGDSLGAGCLKRVVGHHLASLFHPRIGAASPAPHLNPGSCCGRRARSARPHSPVRRRDPTRCPTAARRRSPHRRGQSSRTGRSRRARGAGCGRGRGRS
jgi:hypothetical protein